MAQYIRVTGCVKQKQGGELLGARTLSVACLNRRKNLSHWDRTQHHSQLTFALGTDRCCTRETFLQLSWGDRQSESVRKNKSRAEILCTYCTTIQMREFDLAEESRCASRRSYWFLMPLSALRQTTCLRVVTASHNEPLNVDGNHILLWNTSIPISSGLKRGLSFPAGVLFRQIHK